MSKVEEELPELDIPDDDDDLPRDKNLFDVSDKLKKSSKLAREAQLAREGAEELEEDEGEDEEGEEEEEGGGEVVPPAEGLKPVEEGKGEEGKLDTEPTEGEDAVQPVVEEVAEKIEEGEEGEEVEEEEEVEEGEEVEPEEMVEEVMTTPMESGSDEDEDMDDMEQFKDLPVPEQIMEGILGRVSKRGMSPEEIADSIAEDIVTGKKVRRKKRKEMTAQEIAESIAIEMVTGERPEEDVEEDGKEVPEEVRGALGEAMPGRKERGIARGMVSVMIPGHVDESMDEDVTQYLWEGPCSSTSSSTDKTDKAEVFDKENLMDTYKTLFKDKFILTRKNTFLQKKVYEYYRIKKLTNYFDSIEDDEKLESKYEKEIKQFEEFITHDRDRRAQINMEIQAIENEMQEADAHLHNSLTELMERERGLGVGLLSENGMKVLNEKVVDRLLKRQRECVVKLLVSLQKYIRLRDKLDNKEKQLLMLETIGAEYYLRDYEQLQMENQSYSDKIEERDEELTRLRLNATSSMQILAHIREKANATTNMINDLFESLEMVEMHANEIREHIQKLKKVREQLRKETQKKKCDAGLLVHHQLVKHFEDSIEESNTLRGEVDDFKDLFDAKKRTLSSLRLSMLEAKRQSIRRMSRQQMDYKIFKELLYFKRTQMPDDEETYRKEMDVTERKSFSDQHPGDEKEKKVEQIRKSRPNFFPKGKLMLGSYIH